MRGTRSRAEQCSPLYDKLNTQIPTAFWPGTTGEVPMSSDHVGGTWLTPAFNMIF